MTESIPYFTPAENLHNMRTIATEIAILREEINISPYATHFTEPFDVFVNEWNEFYNDIIESTISSIRLALNSTWTKTQEFKRRLMTWRQKFIRTGGKTLTTDISTPMDSPFSFGKWTWIVISAGVIGFGGWIYTQKIKYTTAKAGLARAISGKAKSHHKGRY